jgi:hypothetical protein
MNSRLTRAAALLATVICAGFAPLRGAAQILPPPPTGSLIVTVTSPASGTTVRGTIPVNASVSIVGSLTVAGVQFRRDGVNIGAEDTSSPYSVSWNTTTASNGSHTLTAVARDQLGVLWTSDPVTVTVSNDITRPTVTINKASTQADPTSSSPINFTAVFSESVSGFTGSDVAIGGTALGTKTVTVSGGPSTYNVAVSGMTSSGTAIATIATGVAQDAAGNTNTASTSTDNSVQFNLDTTRPAVTINKASTQADPTSAAPINFTAVFSEAVSGFTNADVAIGGTALGTKTVTVSGGPSTYTVAVSGMTTSGTVVATIGAGLAQDAAGNTNTASTSTDNSVQFNLPDTTRPAVTINKASTQADPTSASPINFTVVFSEPVSGFSGTDVAIGGTAGGTKSVSVSGSGSTYTAAVSGMTSSGTVIATIAAGVAQDAAGNTNTASTSTDNTVQFNLPDTTRPTVTINQAATQADPTNASPINFTAVFSEAVSGFTNADVAITGTAAGTKTVTVSGGPSTYNVAVSGMTSSGTVIATIAAGVASDAAGNTNTVSTSTNNSVTFDNVRPTVTINQAATQADPTNASPINFTAVFSQPVSGFTGADVAITGTAAGTKTVTVSGGPSTYNVAVSGMTSSGTVIATIAAGVASDAAGNTNTASTSTDNSVTFNTTPPAPTITSFTPASGPAGTVVTITGTNFTGATAVTFNTVGAGFIVDSATQIRAEVPAGATTGPIRVTTPGGTATSSTSFTVTVPAPTITSFTPASGPAGTVVTITGTNFTGTTAVTFNGVGAGFIVDSATQIRAEVPAGATTGPIGVTTPGGTATSSTSFTVTVPAPTITSFTPTSGPAGTVVTITGTNFTGATAVTFNTVGAGFIVDSATSVRAEVPAGATTGPISVTTPGGTATSASNFTVAGDTTVTRFEEDAVIPNPPEAWARIGPEVAAFSGGTAGVSGVTGATGTFTFTGTAVTWVGLKCDVCGIANVAIDGGAATAVDTAGPAAPGSPGLTSEPVFTASGLAAGSHTIVITVTGTTTSGGASIVVDAFDVTGGGSAATTSAASAATRIEDTDPTVSYTGNWMHLTDPRGTNGTAATANVAGAVATLSFTGTEVRWIGYRYDGGGIARLSVDGSFVGEVDTYAPLPEPQAEVFRSVILPAGAHTLTIEATGTRNPAAFDSWVIIDAFDVTP